MFIDRAIGIDLGTTNSAVALLDPSERDLVVWTDRFGRRIMPSAIAWDPKKEEVLVGRSARARRGKFPPPIESIKRSMGQKAVLNLGPLELTPEEASAKILGALAEHMHETLSERVPASVEIKCKRAVVTVPAYFDAPQMEATRRAGEIAGLEILGILQEPTAAAIYHAWRNELGDGNFLIYDLGGGTFDVSILRCLGGEYQVLAIDGDNFLGGDDFDRRFAEHLRGRLATQGYRLDLDVKNNREDAERFSRLRHLAQEIKESLSTRDVVELSRDNIVEDQDGESVSLTAEFGRKDYESIIADLVESTIVACKRALAQSHETGAVGLSEIDHVILVGGSTRVPLVIRRVQEALCDPSRSEAPLQEEVETCVALGAAVHAAQLGGLRFGNENAELQTHGPLVTDSEQLDLRLGVLKAPAGTTGIEVVRSEAKESEGGGPDAEMDYPLAEADLGEIPSPRLTLTISDLEDEYTALSLRLIGNTDGSTDTPGDDVLATVPLTVYRGELRPRATELSQPSVVSKDIALEIVRGGKRTRRVLLPRGTRLPTEQSFRFYTADQSGAVVLRLLQNRIPIKTLMFEVPAELDVGTKVELTLTCDEAMRLEATAKLSDQTLWVKVEEGELVDPNPNEDAVDALIAKTEDVSDRLWGRDAQAFRAESETLVAGLREVVKTDPAKLRALFTRLTLLVDEFRDPDASELSPPRARFELLVDQLRRIVYRSSTTLMGLSREAWEERIRNVESEGLNAHEAQDPYGWRRSYNELQALVETASQEEFTSRKSDDPEYLRSYQSRVLMRAAALKHDLEDLVPSASDDVQALQLRERDRLLGVLQSSVLSPVEHLNVETAASPADFRRELERAGDEMMQLEEALSRIPALGLVTERS